MTDGKVGEPPTWYRTVRAAKFLGVAPWDLEQQSMFWVHAAETAQSVEAEVQKAANARGNKRGPRTNRG